MIAALACSLRESKTRRPEKFKQQVASFELG
jgi:hypothetical protein